MILYYFDSLHENSRNRRDLSSAFNDQDDEFDNYNLTSLDSITVNRDPISDNELASKKYIDDPTRKGTIVRLIKHCKTISKFPLGMMFINLLNMIEYKIPIQQ